MERKLSSVGIMGILIIVIAALGFMRLDESGDFKGTSFGDPYPPAPDINLVRADGAPFRIAAQRGKLVLVFFGYTHCPDVCPTTMAQLKLVADDLGDRSQFIQVVLITVDPDRDAPQIIQDYAGYFNPTFIGLSGSLDVLSGIWDQYGVTRVVNHAGDSSTSMVDHTARITLIDTDGNLRLSYGYQTPYKDIVHDINLLLE